MKKRLTIDIESYWSSEVGFSAGHCVWEYILNPEFYVTAIAHQIDDGDPEVVVFPPPEDVGYDEHKRSLHDHLVSIGYMDSSVVVAHNGAFDFPALYFLTGLVPPMMFCTMLADLYLNGQSEKLSGIQKTYRSSLALESVYQSQVMGNGGEKLEAKDRSALLDTKGKHPGRIPEAELTEFIEYAGKDVFKCNAIFKQIAPLVPSIRRYAIHWSLRQMVQPRLMFAADKAEELFSEATAVMKEELAELGVTEEQLRSAQKFHALMQMYYEPCGKAWPVVQKGKSKGPLMAKSDPLWKQILGDVNTPETVKKIMTLRGTVTAQSRDKRISRYCTISRLLNGLWPVHLMPSGAHTHRLTGGNGSGGNPLNLPKGGSVRDCIEAPEGYTLFVGDYSGMELRVARWFANDETGKQAVLEGRDMYVESAAWSMNKNPGDVTADDRHIGKITQLSAQFGVGARRLSQSCGITEQLAKKFIDTFRQDQHKALPIAWNACNSVLMAWCAGQAPAPESLEPLNLPEGTEFTADGNVVWPSGCTLRYPECHYHEQQVNYKPRGTQLHKIYGPLFFENLVQSLANEIIWERQYQIERELGFDVAFQVYDELIVLIPDDENKEANAAKIAEVMKRPISWWKDAPPMDVDYALADVYSEAK